MGKKRTRTYVVRHDGRNWRIDVDGTELSTLRINPRAVAFGVALQKARIDTDDGFKVEIRTKMPDGALRLDWPPKKPTARHA